MGDGLRFGAIVKQKLDTATTDASGITAQLTALLQNGTPIAAVADRIAKQLADIAARTFGKPLDADARKQLQQTFANALAPPGTGPPGTAAEQAEALRERLRTLLGTLAREAENAGQQNRFSGKILDADTAKEPPAPQPKTSGAPAPAVSSLVESLLTNAVAALRAHVSAPPVASGALASTANPLPAKPEAAQAAPDILARMLARASRSSAAPAASGASATTSPSRSALFARLIAVIEQSAGNNDGSQKNADSHAPLDQKPSPANLQAFGNQISAIAPVTTSSTGATQQSASTLNPVVNPESVIEQVVSGIVMRGTGEGSELRMRLSPDHLGDVSLKLTISGGTIDARIVAQNADVRDMLMSNAHQLARSLAEAGLQLGSFSVDISGNHADTSGEPHQQRTFGTRANRLGSPGDLESADDATESRFGPSLISGIRNPWSLNTLV